MSEHEECKLKKKWEVDVGTIFPGMFPGPLSFSCVGKSIDKFWNINSHDLRKYRIKKDLDDKPFGGGHGMIMRPDCMDSWLSEIYRGQKIIYPSPRGRVFDQSMTSELLENDLIILCGRYEGIDCRVLKHWNIEEVSIGDYILCGGELAAMVMIESCVRTIEGVLGNSKSALEDSFSDGLLENDQYTKPASWVPKNTDLEYNVPHVLRSGNHASISKWILENKENLTENRRSDLWSKYVARKEKNVHS
ncbi:tRNA (guanosine(37)-N1)-methyltransferase TrmD [Candidatus Nesciobacter abundans]|uniref:tRNA (guanine-N(1)-)-methyltransferase n=1 Tax=Candidatus Nesciobacter abundans TaxID=2601668 RepID=A0A5C0UGR7_9PROT|nr:tRNA (guanosine(37)-N1)-methyltransferase TrmD [Candidatus Nesciobacter abundans]QEK38897.1 tRNA (guanosine(37)-N1)-methyltransferase TrmD [Candidatus Nesciobacter abundans]